jgi:hypothetical protein
MKWLIIIFISVGLFSCASSNKDKSEKESESEEKSSNQKKMDDNTDPLEVHAKIDFDYEEYYYDTIEEGDLVTHTFHYVNNGNEPLKIFNVKESCGCTGSQDWNNDTIPIGGEGEITMTFNSTNKLGNQSPYIEVLANTVPNRTKLYLTGFVKEKGD